MTASSEMEQGSDSNQQPFSARRFELDCCDLEPLDKERVALVSTRLAQLDPWLTLAYTPDALGRYLAPARDDLNRLCVLTDGAIAGAICVRFPWLRGAYLELIGLFPEVQGKGIGCTLVEWIAGELPDYARNIWTLVSASNAPARSFYRRRGFVVIGTLEDLVLPGHDEILLRRMVDATDGSRDP